VKSTSNTLRSMVTCPSCGEEARVEATGGIDDAKVIENLVAIMEGGREAFRARKRRYRIDGPELGDIGGGSALNTASALARLGLRGGAAFAAGLVHGKLAGWPFEQAVRFASAVGALATTAVGASEGVRGLEETLALAGLE